VRKSLNTFAMSFAAGFLVWTGYISDVSVVQGEFDGSCDDILNKRVDVVV
jgi:hypothetical protein